MKVLIVAALVFAGLAWTPALAVESEDVSPLKPPVLVPRSAESKAELAARLDDLFAKLKAAPTRSDAKAFERAIVGEWYHSDDVNTDALMFAAVFAMQRSSFTVALHYLDMIVAGNPSYVEGWNKRATVYYYMKDYEHSLADIEKTLALEPRHFGALAGLGMIMIDLGDKRKAITAFERALEVDPALDNAPTVIEQLKEAISKDI